jgi:hypothetical protein
MGEGDDLCQRACIRSYKISNKELLIVPNLLWLRRLDASLSPTEIRFLHQVSPVGSVVERVALGHVFFRKLRFTLVSIFPPML